ncbi:MAG: DUF4062 domain-containing protein [Methanobrevibacter sp.]|jgi:predicted HTH transcriptional regulator|nr:DUF4062 domain-containing protein [Candidatus Methanoflexus mossambicus]
MKKYKIFISSNQREFEVERLKIKDLLENKLGYGLFEVFLFESTPAFGLKPKTIYLDEVKNSDIFIGLIGNEYGTIYENGLSASEEEFDTFIQGDNSQNTFMFIKKEINPDENTDKFIKKAHEVTYKKFKDTDDLLKEIEYSLSKFLLNIKEKQDIEFDERYTHNINMSDIDLNQVNYFIEKSKIDYDISTQKKLENFLINKVKVLKKSDNKFKLSNAGILFFAKKPKDFLPQHEVKIARFQGRDKIHIIDSMELNYPMLLLLDKIEIAIGKLMKIAQKIDGFKRIDIPEYPYTALREAIVNALAHRDYNLKYSSISIFIFENRIEITSPGKSLIKIKSIEDIYAHRNNKICDLFRRTFDMEKFGTGIKKMNKIMKENKMQHPEFKSKDDFFKTIFYNRSEKELMDLILEDSTTVDLKKLGLNNKEITALELMINHKKIFSPQDYAEYFNVSDRTARRHLSHLVNEGLIDKIQINGNKKNGYYGIKSNTNL